MNGRDEETLRVPGQSVEERSQPSERRGAGKNEEQWGWRRAGKEKTILKGKVKNVAVEKCNLF